MERHTHFDIVCCRDAYVGVRHATDGLAPDALQSVRGRFSARTHS